MDEGKIQLVLVPMTESERESSEAVLAAAEAWLEARDALRAAKKRAGDATFVPCDGYGQFYDRCRKCPPCLAEAEALGAMWKARAQSSGKTLKLRNAVLRFKGVKRG